MLDSEWNITEQKLPVICAVVCDLFFFGNLENSLQADSFILRLVLAISTCLDNGLFYFTNEN